MIFVDLTNLMMYFRDEFLKESKGDLIMKLTIEKLQNEALNFCRQENTKTHDELLGVTDGKAIGTYIEHKFEKFLEEKYEVTIGSSAKGIDLPDKNINTDIKVTSVKKPQSSTPFENIERKIYGLGHNLLIFIYEKTDINNKCYLDFKNCLFIKAERTGDYNLTKILGLLIKNDASEEDIIEVLKDNNVPGDKQYLKGIAKKILENPPIQGYLTISNALQWRLKYNNVLNLEETIDGIYNYEEFSEKELGDYQTPLYFTDIICEYLKNNLNISPEVIIEPTCGIGNFLESASKIFQYKQIYGIEIDEYKINKINKEIDNLKLINEDIFTFDFDEIDKNKTFLIIGNPPWITNTELSKLNSKNIPTKSNFKNKTGYEALTGTSNFDISEYIILKMINEFKNTESTIAFLCKTTVSRNIFIELIKNEIEYSFIKQLNFNSYKIFKIDADACLFVIQFGGKKVTDKICEVTDISNPSKVLYKFGFISDKFYSNITDIPLIDGECQFEWRQGVKHDCAKVMELNYENDKLTNKQNKTVSIENTLVYPLLKSSNLKKPIVNETSKYIIIPQKKIKQNTDYIKTDFPKTWNYLNNNKEFFDKRKSSIYNNAPDFSIFGIGEYSFNKYKVAISGFYKEPMFSLAYNKKAVMLDDTCYFLSFNEYDDAYITMILLNTSLVKKFLKSIAFLDSKRPYAKKVLKRIDIKKALSLLSFNDLKETEKELELNNYITAEKFQKYMQKYS